MSDSSVNYALPQPPYAPYSSGFPTQAPAFKLFDAPAVTMATFLGTPAAGALLMAVNYKRLGKGGSAALLLVLGIVAGALEVLLGYAAPQSASGGVGVAFLIVMGFAARKLQGPAVSQHTSAHGPLGSRWAAAGIGMAFLCVVVAAVAIPVTMNSARTKVTIGTKDEVYFSGSATKADAQALGDSLKRIGYFQDKGTSVFLDKGDGTTISLVQREGVWDEPEMLANSEEVVREVASSVGGLPIKVKLINTAEAVKKTGVIGRTVIGTKDEVFYEGNATDADAQALGNALKDAKYFQGRGTSVILSKDGRGTVMSFVVSDGIWDDAASVAAFEVIARGTASTVGGLPVTLRLVNTGLEMKKEVKIQ